MTCSGCEPMVDESEEQNQKPLVRCCHGAELVLGLVCPVCYHATSSVQSAPYGVHAQITELLEQEGWQVVAAHYERPEVSPCSDGQDHNWEGKWLAGILFRRCLKCGRFQRCCYRPYFEDVPPLSEISESEWATAEDGPSEDMRPGGLTRWG